MRPHLLVKGRAGFNPSRGIAIIQTDAGDGLASQVGGFNPSRGIAIIQTEVVEKFHR